ncbi:hypothetical protein [Roseivirga spongicola]|uniref:hypothetical protein n=1 Tax=Roseivirga spongicola TaxID=333140 RepID=UPI002AC934A2|nr:hypothetical protein [Roseivirga spongicola]WPZ08734.1 hypothetical protein T7867_10740 [Roseivirga spongicola]
MKEFKGTKGEWWTKFSELSLLSPEGESIVKAGEIGTPVCILPMPLGGIDTKAKNIANAQLIAAAPQLLEALDKASKALKNIKSQLTKEESDEVLNAHLDAERAIKKALGE